MSDRVPNLAALVPSVAADVVIEERSIPSPEPGEVLIRNHAIAINPIDWKRQAWNFKIASFPVILGSDVAGVVVKVGSNVTNVKIGDRVLGFAGSFLTEKNEHAAFQTYSIVADYAVSKIPDAMSFKAAATLPQGAITTVLAFFDSLGLPLPTGESFTGAIPALSPYVLLVWGASSSVGFLNVQIARMIGLTVYAVASSDHHEKLRAIGATEVFDYHATTVVDDIVAAAERAGKMISYASDVISEAHTIAPIMKVLAKVPRQKKLAYTLTWPKEEPHVDGIDTIHPSGEEILDRRVDLCAWLFKSALPRWLEDGAIEPLKQHVVEGGISGIQAAMNRSKAGVHMEKVVVEL